MTNLKWLVRPGGSDFHAGRFTFASGKPVKFVQNLRVILRMDRLENRPACRRTCGKMVKFNKRRIGKDDCAGCGEQGRGDWRLVDHRPKNDWIDFGVKTWDGHIRSGGWGQLSLGTD